MLAATLTHFDFIKGRHRAFAFDAFAGDAFLVLRKFPFALQELLLGFAEQIQLEFFFELGLLSHAERLSKEIDYDGGSTECENGQVEGKAIAKIDNEVAAAGGAATGA